MPHKFHLLKLLFLLSLLIFSDMPGFGQSYWTPEKSNLLPVKGKRTLIPDQYKTFALDQNNLKSFLKDLNNQPSDGSILNLPTPEGGLMAFRIWKTPVWGAAMQRKYPMIQTFTAFAVQNPYISAKIDYTVFGFHAMVFQPGKVWMIDPYDNIADGYYISFYQSDAAASSKGTICLLNNQNKKELSPSGQPLEIVPSTINHLKQRPSDNIKRTYRLALSCTGEYAEAVGGAIPTKASVLSAMITTLNRVNGIYEREVDVTMQLINQEDSLIYLNPNTDPFTANNNGDALLGQNQTNTDNVVGNGSYDIGHIFSTGGGGVAYLGSVCHSADKAQGVTGLANPTGDAFAVDYVAHEMGHQFDANHTFNDCNGNENWSTAYEPGSGSTIMAYAGICGPDNDLQEHSDDYFHAISLTEITDYLDGFGGTCATTANLSVSIPTFSSIQQNYVIPASTPFELEAPAATTGDSQDSLSYCWEQWDLGDLQSPEISGATLLFGPIFRSVYPKENNRWRVFPNLDNLVQNQNDTTGERLTEENRNLDFKLTVRNIQEGWGSFQIADDSLHIQVVNTNRPFEVTAPDATGLIFPANSNINVTWDVASTQNAPINCQNVDIYFSKDGGYTYPYTLATNVSNSGQATVTLPNVNTDEGRIKVKGHGNIFFDISNNNFSTQGATGINDITFKQQFKIAPNPATNKVFVSTNYSGTLNAILFNVLGQSVWKGSFKKQATIYTESLSRGIYFLKISDPVNTNEQVTKKIILQ